MRESSEIPKPSSPLALTYSAMWLMTGQTHIQIPICSNKKIEKKSGAEEKDVVANDRTTLSRRSIRVL